MAYGNGMSWQEMKELRETTLPKLSKIYGFRENGYTYNTGTAMYVEILDKKFGRACETYGRITTYVDEYELDEDGQRIKNERNWVIKSRVRIRCEITAPKGPDHDAILAKRLEPYYACQGYTNIGFIFGPWIEDSYIDKNDNWQRAIITDSLNIYSLLPLLPQQIEAMKEIMALSPAPEPQSSQSDGEEQEEGTGEDDFGDSYLSDQPF